MAENKKACSDSKCTKESCKGCSKKPKTLVQKTHELNSIHKVIGVASGKGGVGKSLVTSMLAVLLTRKGYQVGILDADITGPSIPQIFGIHKMAESGDNGILPQHTPGGIRVMSVNLLVRQEDTPVIWRGPMMASAVKQFWTDVIWGDLDYLFIDMPPGTGDVPLTVFRSIPLDGVVIVTSPQELVSMIVRKAVNMAQKMDIPVLGVVENMSYVKCPDCGKEIRLFGESKLSETAGELGLRVLGRLPIDPEIAGLVDKGEFDSFKGDYLEDAAVEIEKLLLKE